VAFVLFVAFRLTAFFVAVARVETFFLVRLFDLGVTRIPLLCSLPG
jgi:hypothetical protein